MELLHSTIGDSLSLRARQSPDKLALVYRDQSYTWSEIDRITDYLAVRMDHQGIRKGTHVGIWSVNTPNWILTFLALEKLGAIPGADQYLLQDGRIAEYHSVCRSGVSLLRRWL